MTEELSDLGTAIEGAIIEMMKPERWRNLKFHEQMHLLDKALKLEAIKQRKTEPADGAWFRSNFEEEEEDDGPERDSSDHSPVENRA